MTRDEIAQRLAKTLQVTDPIQPPADLIDYYLEAQTLTPTVEHIAMQWAAELFWAAADVMKDVNDREQLRNTAQTLRHPYTPTSEDTAT